MVDLDQLKTTLVPGVLDAGTLDGKTYGVPMSMNVKSLVWYPKKAFEAKGYKVPTTIARARGAHRPDQGRRHHAVVHRHRDGRRHRLGRHRLDRGVHPALRRPRGLRPVGQATRSRSPTRRSKAAFRSVREAGAAPTASVFGGRKSIVSTTFGTSVNPMFDNPPKCCCSGRATSSPEGFWPTRTSSATSTTNVGVFPCPASGGYTASRCSAAATWPRAFTKDDDVKKVHGVPDHLRPSSAEMGGGRGWLSPHKTFDVSKYPDETDQEDRGGRRRSTVFRFDGSDLMPGAVGAGTFWQGMVAWIGGQQRPGRRR